MVLIKKHRQLETSAIIFIFGLCVAFANYTGIEGSREPCQFEGEPVAVDHIDQSRCFSCVCKNGFVECRNDNNCPSVDGCHLLVAEKNRNKNRSRDTCCRQCKECIYKGVRRRSHTEWPDPDNPCKVLRCEAGVVTESDVKCYTPCSEPWPPEPGKCCPTCPECKINGQVATDDRDVIADDPCVKCRCTKRGMLCTKKACPVLQCGPNYQEQQPGECCPKCIGTRSLLEPKNGCMIQADFMAEGTVWNIDECSQCVCLNTTSICKRNACPVLDCSPELQRTVPGSCCKVCTLPERFSAQCRFKKTVYEDGQSWRMNACRSCKCNRGQISCAMIRCNMTLTCGPGTKLVHEPEECCAKCEELDGVCMVYGDPHYKTFDGKLYTFHGVGKYQLIADCPNRTFSIKVANAYSNSVSRRNHKRVVRTSTKRVAITYGTTRINLQQRLRIKYNGNIVKLPFQEDHTAKLMKVGDNVEVSLSNGVKILWSGKSFLEISVPAKFKDKVCGLCGNFNSNAQDDLRMNNGKVVRDTEIHRFGASWCVGSRANCTKQAKLSARMVHCNNPRPEINYCRYLNDRSVVGNCISIINANKYYDTCKMDTCDCASDKKCYCDSLQAYARECERAGAKMPDWRRRSNCHVVTSPMSAIAAHRRRNKAPQKDFMLSEENIKKFRMLTRNITLKDRIPLMIH